MLHPCKNDQFYLDIKAHPPSKMFEVFRGQDASFFAVRATVRVQIHHHKLGHL